MSGRARGGPRLEGDDGPPPSREKFPFNGAIIHSLAAVSLFVAQGAVSRISLSSRASHHN